MALDDITKFIGAGRGKRHPKNNEVNDLISHDVHSLEDLDDWLTTFGTPGIDVLAGQPELPSSALEEKFEEDVEAGELDLSSNALETTKPCAARAVRGADYRGSLHLARTVRPSWEDKGDEKVDSRCWSRPETSSLFPKILPRSRRCWA